MGHIQWAISACTFPVLLMSMAACMCRQEQQQGSSPLEQQAKTKTDTGLSPEQLQEVRQLCVCLIVPQQLAQDSFRVAPAHAQSSYCMHRGVALSQLGQLIRLLTRRDTILLLVSLTAGVCQATW
jgi:hypothetical protein